VGGGAVLILAFFHAHRSDGGGEGGAGCEEASAFDFPLPPFGMRSSRKAWNLVVDSRLANSPSLQLLLISWAVMACFLHRKVAGQMLPMGPRMFRITFSLTNLGFCEWGL
jgi:hypothetical protein